MFLGDAFLLGDAFFLGDTFFTSDASRYFKQRKIETENQGTVFFFSNLFFSFIWVTSLKNPGKGKKASPLTRLLHSCFT